MELGLHLHLHLSLPPSARNFFPFPSLSRSTPSTATSVFRRRCLSLRAVSSKSNLTSPEVDIEEIEEIEEDEEDWDDDDEEEEEDDDELAMPGFLSLSMKPDRNMALLDEYELEELDTVTDPNHRSGYVAVLGKPNVGKSTLSNQMVGQKLSIVTDKPQTTRHRILGICSGSEYQMILYDTPGVIEKKMHKLDSMMMKNVKNAAVNADCVLVVVDACKAPQKIDDILEENMGNLKDKPPVLLVLNKKDMIKPGEMAKKLEAYASEIEFKDGKYRLIIGSVLN